MIHPSPCRICATRGHYSVRDVLEWPLAAAGVVLVIVGVLTQRIDVPLGGGVRWRSKP